MVKNTGDSTNNKIKLAMRSGKILLGYKNTLRSIRRGESKMVFIASNCPLVRKYEIEYYAALAEVSIKIFSGNNINMGTTLGKYFRCSVFSIINPGDSDILVK
ncbi:60S ribosomal protein L30-like [Hippocampus zosterae]|uniref:60S ribosomal protein L30-like n=1 Tax=Hippocampus zosterae TaxID=109293 RepID=UPI00223CFB90|nr:60S ribosomal protein L30-like [Hippocampus zosterae]